MKIWYPIKFDSNKYINTALYISECQLMLLTFKAVLKNNIKRSRWLKVYQTITTTDPPILPKTFKKNKIFDIVNQYVDSLKCTYDSAAGKCYYDVSNIIRVSGTNISVAKLIKLIEFGNKDIPPMNWIRHSYLVFIDIVMRNK